MAENKTEAPVAEEVEAAVEETAAEETAAPEKSENTMALRELNGF